MKTDVLLIEYPGCPYCFQTRRILRELIGEYPEYSSIQFQEVNILETADGRYEYEYTPVLIYQDHKIYECDPGWSADQVKKYLQAALNKVLESMKGW